LASRLPSVPFPEAAGPSMAMIMRIRTLVLLHTLDATDRFLDFGKSRWIDDNRISDFLRDLCGLST
jgi:hypothetical protein